jgi:hypothetical protein
MTLTINDTMMTSDQTAHTARQAPSREHLWEVSWLPGRVLDRNSAITAMVLADQAGVYDLSERRAAPPLAAHRISQPGAPGQRGRETERPDPEAGQ